MIAFVLSALIGISHAAPPERSFDHVLSGLVERAGVDAKKGELRLRETNSIRRIELSPNIPKSFQSILRAKVEARFLRAGVSIQDRTLSKKSPERWLDLGLEFSPERMILSVSVIDVSTQGTLVLKRYDSEDPIEDLNVNTDRIVNYEYPPVLSHRVFMRWFDAPDFSSRTQGLGVSYRLVEAYRNRTRELGFEIGTHLGMGKNGVAAQSFKPPNAQLTLVHLWSLSSEPWAWDRFRPFLSVELGGRYGAEVFGFLSRVGLEGRMGTSTSIGLYVTKHQKSSTLFGSQPRQYSGYEVSLGAGLIWDSN